MKASVLSFPERKTPSASQGLKGLLGIACVLAISLVLWAAIFAVLVCIGKALIH